MCSCQYFLKKMHYLRLNQQPISLLIYNCKSTTILVPCIEISLIHRLSYDAQAKFTEIWTALHALYHSNAILIWSLLHILNSVWVLRLQTLVVICFFSHCLHIFLSFLQGFGVKIKKNGWKREKRVFSGLQESWSSTYIISCFCHFS